MSIPEGTKCCAMVWQGWHRYPCGNKASVEREGKFYCKVHDPVRIEEKAKIRDKEVEERRIERNRWIVLGHPDYRVMEKALNLVCKNLPECPGYTYMWKGPVCENCPLKNGIGWQDEKVVLPDGLETEDCWRVFYKEKARKAIEEEK